MLVPMLDQIIRDAAAAETKEVVMGMAHRGRLNVLTHILGKPYAAIVAEFESAKQDTGASVAGDGQSGLDGRRQVPPRRAAHATRRSGAADMPITLAPNPSHLEFVNPVVEGRARAAQETRDQPGKIVRDVSALAGDPDPRRRRLPRPGHRRRDAEPLAAARLLGRRHDPHHRQQPDRLHDQPERLPLHPVYASDLAKGFEIPIVHVNADDPEACIAAARMAFAYREKFGKDFLIDLIGYRRYGHNEGDEPSFTQPRMYEIIAQHPTVRALWAEKLEERARHRPRRGRGHGQGGPGEAAGRQAGPVHEQDRQAAGPAAWTAWAGRAAPPPPCPRRR